MNILDRLLMYMLPRLAAVHRCTEDRNLVYDFYSRGPVVFMTFFYGTEWSLHLYYCRGCGCDSYKHLYRHRFSI